MVRRVARLRRIASAAARRSPDTSVRSEASIATSVPVPILERCPYVRAHGLSAIMRLLSDQTCASTLTTAPLGSRTKKRRIPHGSSTGPETTPRPPRRLDRPVDPLEAAPLRLGVRRVDRGRVAEVDAHVRHRRVDALLGDDDLGAAVLRRLEPEKGAPALVDVHSDLEAEDADVKLLDGLEVAGLEVRDDALRWHRPDLSPRAIGSADLRDLSARDTSARRPAGTPPGAARPP